MCRLSPICGDDSCARALLVTLLSLLIASCTSMTIPFPDSWAPIEYGRAGGYCPSLEGIYEDHGEYTGDRFCEQYLGECNSLSFALLTDLLFNHRLRKSEFERGRISQLKIMQPKSDVLEIITKPDEKKYVLSKSTGDFTCDSDGLRITKASGNSALITNFILSETRTFNISKDQSLIMKSESNQTGIHIVIPYNFRHEGWAKWKRSDLIETTVEPPSLTSTANPDYLECVTRGDRKCDDVVNCVANGKRQWTNRSKCD